MYVTYTAKRSLRSGVSSGSSQNVEIPLVAHDRKPQSISSTVRSLSGAQQTVFHRFDNIQSITTAPTKDTTIQAKMVEFLDSVLGGESFTIDPRGTQASSDNPFTAILSPLSYTPSRLENVYFRYSFQVLEV